MRLWLSARLVMDAFDAKTQLYRKLFLAMKILGMWLLLKIKSRKWDVNSECMQSVCTNATSAWKSLMTQWQLLSQAIQQLPSFWWNVLISSALCRACVLSPWSIQANTQLEKSAAALPSAQPHIRTVKTLCCNINTNISQISSLEIFYLW